MAPNVTVYIVYYSMFGQVERLAQEIKRGVDSVEGVESRLWQVPETLTMEELGELGAPPKSNVPIITPNQLPHADGYVFGFPTKFGMMAAQFQSFLDSTNSLWELRALEGKPAGIFFSTSYQGGGEETPVLTSFPYLVNHGMIFVPTGYKYDMLDATMIEIDRGVESGSPYGAVTYAGSDGFREPYGIELRQAFQHGKYIATITKKLETKRF